MIYTLTLNPAVDCYIYQEIKQNDIVRVSKQRFEAGGKGLNVAMALKNLGVEVTAITILGGFTGKFIKEELNEKGLNTIAISSERTTRLNVKLLGNDELQYNVLNEVTDAEVKKVKRKLFALLKPEDILVVSGSGSYAHYSQILKRLPCPFILDVEGFLLKDLAKFGPLMVKPNDDELDKISLDTTAAYRYLLHYTKIVLHTRGKDGSVLRSREKRLSMDVLGEDIMTTVGCGDAYLAGFLKCYLEGQTMEDCFYFGAKVAYFRAKYGRFPKINEVC